MTILGRINSSQSPLGLQCLPISKPRKEISGQMKGVKHVPARIPEAGSHDQAERS